MEFPCTHVHCDDDEWLLFYMFDQSPKELSYMQTAVP